MPSVFLDYYRCPSQFAGFGTKGEFFSDEGDFPFRGAPCYGPATGGGPQEQHSPTPLPPPPPRHFPRGGWPSPSISELVTKLKEGGENYNTQRPGQTRKKAPGRFAKHLLLLPANSSGRGEKASAEDPPERMEQDRLPRLARRLHHRDVDAGRDGAGPEEWRPAENPIHLVLAGWRTQRGRHHARCGRSGRP